MLVTLPVYNSALTQEQRILNSALIEEIMPHANVPVDPGAVDTPCCEARFFSHSTTIILLPFDEVKTRLAALTGIVDITGTLL